MFLQPTLVQQKVQLEAAVLIHTPQMQAETPISFLEPKFSIRPSIHSPNVHAILKSITETNLRTKSGTKLRIA